MIIPYLSQAVCDNWMQIAARSAPIWFPFSFFPQVKPHAESRCVGVGVAMGVGVIVVCMRQCGAFDISAVFAMLDVLVHVFVWAHENAHVAYARARWSMCARV